ncbi:DUF6678 family protein [uncultured Aquimarina sp.]|uniref:DUF6678 family protein n=1 Tax=uncultured Aquimarina sp. TaxID=575652 RepID=UPI0026337689|nr:DUF6678 family protein [uncultured Aquimarina sp.]
MSRVDKYQLKLQQEIDSRASFMSDTKWKALFSLLKDVNPQYVTKVKLLLDDTIREFTIPDEESFLNEKYIEEYWGVFELKEIEWILIPSEIISERKNREELLTSKVKTQNIELIETALQTGKQFEYELSKSGLKVYGYK